MLKLRSWKSLQERAAFAALFHLSWPVIMSRLGVMLMAVMDTIVVGQYSSAQLGFMMLAQSVFWVPAVTGMGLLMGIQVKTSHYLGSGDLHRIGAVFQRGIAYALVLGMAFTTLLLLAGFGFLGLVEPVEMAHGAQLPLAIFAVSMPLFLLSIACTQFLEALGRTRDVLMATLLANGLNVVLLLAFVTGFDFPGLHLAGAVGAATATLVARSALGIGLFVYVVSLKQTKPFGLLEKQETDHQGAVDQRHVGYATGASYFIEVSAFAGMTLFAGRLGETSVAAWAVILNFASLVFMVPMGLSAGCSVLVGKAFGAGDKAGIARTGQVSFLATAGFMIMVVLCVLTLKDTLAGFYTHDIGVLTQVRDGLLLSCCFYLPDGLQVVAAQALRARRDVLVPTVIHYLSYGFIMLPLGYVFCLALNWGVQGLVGAVIVASLMSGTFQTCRFLWLDKGSTDAKFPLK